MGFLLSKLLPLLLYPLGLGLLLQLSGQLSGSRARGLNSQRWRRLSQGLGWGGIGLIWLFALPITSRQLIWGLEEPAAALTPSPLPRADAVVVLGGGLRPALPPRQAVEVAEGGDRLLTGLRLLRRGQAPLLVTSGARVSFSANDPAQPEALSARALALELGAQPGQILVNPESRTTAEEAAHIGAMGRQRGWRRILLVTSGFHMPRSLATFQARSGLEVIPVSCDFQLPSRQLAGQKTIGSLALDLIPDASALALSTVALKEHLGLAIYRLRGWS
jgi:uncharacterized SAM-binding protein YcdF (DUF218 family)